MLDIIKIFAVKRDGLLFVFYAIALISVIVWAIHAGQDYNKNAKNDLELEMQSLQHMPGIAFDSVGSAPMPSGWHVSAGFYSELNNYEVFYHYNQQLVSNGWSFYKMCNIGELIDHPSQEQVVVYKKDAYFAALFQEDQKPNRYAIELFWKSSSIPAIRN